MGEPKTITKGSLGMEVVLWLFCLLPGLVYSTWRLVSRYRGCPHCGGMMLSGNSPAGQSLAQKYYT